MNSLFLISVRANFLPRPDTFNAVFVYFISDINP